MPTQLSFMDQWTKTEDILDPATPEPAPETQAPPSVETQPDAPTS